jgi:hypothetical protein
MSSTGINTLTTGTINGLNSLALDELTTNTFTSGTISGDLFYIDRVEAKEVIVDTRLTLTNTGVISVGDKIISDIELTYLDGVTSNIQTQINAISGQESGLASTVALHTTQITALQATDVIHSNKIGDLEDETGDLYDQVNAHTSQIAVLENKTMFQTRNSTATIFSKQINIPNGNIGYVNTTFFNDLNIQSNLEETDNIVLNSGLANIYLKAQYIHIGKPDAPFEKKGIFSFIKVIV